MKKDILKIPKGNDFKIRISPQRIAPRQGEGASFAPIEGLSAMITRQNGESVQADYTLTEDGDIIVNIPSTLKSVTYGLELTGVYEGDKWRWGDCSLFQIVDCNPCSNVQPLESFAADTYDIFDLPIPSLEEETLALETNGHSWISGGTLYIMGAENADGSGFISRVVVMDNHGNVLGDAVLATADRDTAIAEHNESELAHQYLRGLIRGVGITANDKVSEIYLKGQKASEIDPDTQERIVRIGAELLGKVDDVIVNGQSVLDELYKARFSVPVNVTDLADHENYATQEEAQSKVDEARITGGRGYFVEDGGEPSITVVKNERTLEFTFRNFKGLKGDTVVLDPEHVQYYTLYTTKGSNTDGAMTQDAVTRALDALETSVVHHGAQDVNVSISPNNLHVWDVPMAELNITLATAPLGMASEHMIRFTAPSDQPASVSIQPDVKWIEEPEWSMGSTYEISIVNGLGVYAEWEEQE